MHRERRCAAPARRTSEDVPGEYGERAQRSWSGCSGARMPGYLRDAALGRIALFLLCFAALLASPWRIFAEGEGPGKWDESTAGRWESLPERHVGGTDNGISVEVTMSPGTGVSYVRTGNWEPGPATL